MGDDSNSLSNDPHAAVYFTVTHRSKRRQVEVDKRIARDQWARLQSSYGRDKSDLPRAAGA